MVGAQSNNEDAARAQLRLAQIHALSVYNDALQATHLLHSVAIACGDRKEEHEASEFAKDLLAQIKSLEEAMSLPK